MKKSRKMNRLALHTFLTFYVLCDAGRAIPPQKFPEWRSGGESLDVEWSRAPAVAVGEIENPRLHRDRPLENPYPSPLGPVKAYWCEGDFRTVAVLKGSLDPPVGKYVWAAPTSDCQPYERNPEFVSSQFRTRVWFLRKEAGFLRPLFDGGGASPSVGFCELWEDGAPMPPRQRLGVFLLTPWARCAETPGQIADYANNLVNIGDFACALLGRTECIDRIQSLANSGSPALRVAACEYLDGQQQTSCN